MYSKFMKIFSYVLYEEFYTVDSWTTQVWTVGPLICSCFSINMLENFFGGFWQFEKTHRCTELPKNIGKIKRKLGMSGMHNMYVDIHLTKIYVNWLFCYW